MIPGAEGLAAEYVKLGAYGIVFLTLLFFLVRSERRCDRLEQTNDGLRNQLQVVSDKRIDENKTVALVVERVTVLMTAVEKVLALAARKGH